ncbi:bifunctional diguanylate cyclase/phosphodiesterase [Actinoplanes sp. NPDC051851]|uniref:putative bifunctional diguanylate cyclase/phosphodiesterase n=1 Tax=Actinoplanes sp. NPDC051851 TaxID=3154753 RepID=UPI003436741C
MLAGGLIAVAAVQLFAGPAAGVAFLALQIVGTALTARVPNPTVGWRLLVVSRLAGMIVLSWWLALDNRGHPALGTTDSGLSMVPQYTLYAVAVLLMTRRRRSGSLAENGVEAGSLVLCLAMLAWSFIVLPYLGDPGYRQVDTALATLYAVIDVAVLAAALRGTRPRCGVPGRLLGLSGLLMLGAHLLYAATGGAGTGPFLPGGHSFLLIQVAGVVATAAAVHPRARDLGVLGSAESEPIRRGKLAGIVVAAVVGPLVPVLAALALNRSMTADQIVPAVITSALCVLLVLRILLLARRTGQQAAALRVSLAEQGDLQERLVHRAGHDVLTGLANRELLIERLGGSTALLLIALDGFKEVNDTYGHQVGDEVLRQLAGRLLLFASDAVVVARLGGDEFGLVPADPAGAAALGERVLETISAVPLTVDDRKIHLTASIGLAEAVPEKGSTAKEKVLGDADLALRSAKRAGGARLVRFDESLRAEQNERARIAAGLRQALADGSLFLHYQPVVETATGRMRAVEALMRWSPDGVPVPPGVFIPVAEQSGLIVAIGTLALRLACARGAEWHRRFGIYVTVNVSTHQLRDPVFGDTVLAVLAETGLPPAGLVLEITESVLIDAADTTVLERLRERGVRIAIDDFGTGYSSLAYLHQLPVDILKIDRAFISRDAAVIRAILELARSQDMTTVAEGVETAEQAAMLWELGCPLVQGYHFARPCDPAVIETMAAVQESSSTAV